MASTASPDLIASVINLREEHIFNASYDRCVNLNDGDVRFVSHFYSTLKCRDTKLAEIFEAFPVHDQVKAVRTAIYVLADFRDSKTPSLELSKLIELHTDARLGIQAYMLDIWLDCLLETVAEFDSEYCEATQAAWRTRIQPGLDFLRSEIEKNR